MIRREIRRTLLRLICLSTALVGLGWPRAATAQPCNAPPVAVDDEAFHQGLVLVVDVLANDFEPDGEALSISAASTTCAGTLSEDLGLLSLLPAAPVSEDCTISYQIRDERGAVAGATVQVRDADVLFHDGFESGDTGRWSAEGEAS